MNRVWHMHCYLKLKIILTDGLFDGTLDGLIDTLGFTEGWKEGNALILGLKEGIFDDN